MAKCTARVNLKDDDGVMLRDDDGNVLSRPCERAAIAGGTVCPAHGGSSPQVKAKAAVRDAVMRWGLSDLDIADVDPGQILLRVLKQSAARAEMLAQQLEKLVSDHGGDIQAAMVADTMIVTRDGEPIKAGEYIRGLAELEFRERVFCRDTAAKAVAAGLATRQVELAERQGAQLAQLMLAVFDELGLSDEQREAAPDVLDRHLRVVTG